jgi:hypothetical protein
MLPDMKIIFNERLNKIQKFFTIEIKNHLNSHIPNKPKKVTGNQFFHFELDEGNTITASLMGNDEIRVYVEYVDSDYRPNKIMIGILLDDVVVQDTTINWSKRAKFILEHEYWPECLDALNRAAIVASVILT